MNAVYLIQTTMPKERRKPQSMSNKKDYEGLSLSEAEGGLMHKLTRIIRIGVRILAVLMVIVIIWGIFDVIWVIYNQLMAPPIMILKINDIFAIFGAFLAVLIAIEIFLNITLYLREDIIHVKLVVATALMAIARKVIVFDFPELDYKYVLATGVVVLALGITYWLISRVEG